MSTAIKQQAYFKMDGALDDEGYLTNAEEDVSIFDLIDELIPPNFTGDVEVEIFVRPVKKVKNVYICEPLPEKLTAEEEAA